MEKKLTQKKTKQKPKPSLSTSDKASATQLLENVLKLLNVGMFFGENAKVLSESKAFVEQMLLANKKSEETDGK